ncbi:MAG: helix-turn-helix transcriptional regulator [Ruminococcaceae bacterium]|nr:helix-turn-helix transcriptional regulator [Oscillospiraceae bacterium]
MDISNMIVELFDVFVFEEKNDTPAKLRSKTRRNFSALSMRIGSSDTTYYCNGEVIKAENGDICLVPQNTEYIRVAKKEKILVFHFNVHNYISPSIKCFKIEDKKTYEEMFFKALCVWQKKQPGYRYEATSILCSILAKLQKDGMLLEASEDRILSKALEIIESNFKSPSFKIQSVSEKLFISSASLRQKFSRRFSLTPKQYLEKRRIKEAIIMLKSNYFSQKEIAVACGFSDVKYFRYAFKKEIGKTISDFNKTVLSIPGANYDRI